MVVELGHSSELLWRTIGGVDGEALEAQVYQEGEDVQQCEREIAGESRGYVGYSEQV